MSRGGYIHGKVGDYRWVVGFFLIISVLNGTTSFMLSFYKIPVKVKRQLTQIQSNFLWGGVSQKRSIHWVSYDKFFLPKDKGGLGVKDIGLFNVSLLLKWKWGILNDLTTVWSKMIEYRYRSFRFPILSSGIRIWRCWLSLKSIKEDYSELFMRSVLQVSGVDGMGDWVDKEWKWNLHLEKRSLDSGADSNSDVIDVELKVSLDILWNTSNPSKFILFTWRLLLDRLMTKNLLLHRVLFSSCWGKLQKDFSEKKAGMF
ncbi:hypothetical protein KIW84_031800 [Lathyrus oleraceus]|uniref:Reverse transcriptase zinc-binding domain-containing protein n=1 Tax=Pisum sativum TaxID=3888 RepID=A0A9D4XVU9_PEA|nr:hypothetical protein KIW84_031800 [Pisum sativum]